MSVGQKKGKKRPARKSQRTGIKKSAKPLNTDPPKCKVTFTMPREAAKNAKGVAVVGDFNKWNINKTPLKKQKNGDFAVTVELPCNIEYSFKYVINPHEWPDPLCAEGKCVSDSYMCED